MIERVKSVWNRISDFLHRDVWYIEMQSLSFLKRMGVQVSRVVYLSAKGIRDDELPLRAASLTFATLMALVPLLAFTISIAKGFGGGELAIVKLTEAMADMPEEFRAFVTNILDYVSNTNFVALGGTMMLIVFYTVIKVMGTVEASFNHIWGVSAHRTLFRKVTDYLSTLVIVPVFVLAAAAMSASFSVGSMKESLGAFVGAYAMLLKLTPLVVTWLAFIFLYLFMPNTRVKILPAIVGAFVGAVTWLAWQKLYIVVQVGVGRYNAIFGTFAAIPIFMIWLFYCWIIVLLGAEVAFSMQNYGTYQQEREAYKASSESKVVLALNIVLSTAKAMSGKGEVFNVTTYSSEEQVPIRLLREVVSVLKKAHILTEVREHPGGVVLVTSPELLKVQAVIDAIYQYGATPDAVGVAHLDQTVQGLLDKVGEGVQSSLGDMTFKDLLTQQSTQSGSTIAMPAS